MTDRTEPAPEPANIVSLTDVISKRRWEPKKCEHQRIEVDPNNREVQCKDCGKLVEPFEVLCTLADKASLWQRRHEQLLTDERNLAGYVPHLRAVRDLESMWRGKRLPMCPHCKKGVTAEAMAKMGWVHRSYAERVAEHERAQAPAEAPVPLHDGGGDGPTPAA